jgi:hypothetical protein
MKPLSSTHVFVLTLHVRLVLKRWAWHLAFPTPTSLHITPESSAKYSMRFILTGGQVSQSLYIYLRGYKNSSHFFIAGCNFMLLCSSETRYNNIDITDYKPLRCSVDHLISTCMCMIHNYLSEASYFQTSAAASYSHGLQNCCTQEVKVLGVHVHGFSTL